MIVNCVKLIILLVKLKVTSIAIKHHILKHHIPELRNTGHSFLQCCLWRLYVLRVGLCADYARDLFVPVEVLLRVWPIPVSPSLAKPILCTCTLGITQGGGYFSTVWNAGGKQVENSFSTRRKSRTPQSCHFDGISNLHNVYDIVLQSKAQHR